MNQYSYDMGTFKETKLIIICIEIYWLCKTLMYCTLIIGIILMKLIYVKCFTKCYQCNMWYTNAVFKKSLTYITNVKKYNSTYYVYNKYYIKVN